MKVVLEWDSVTRFTATFVILAATFMFGYILGRFH